MLLLRRLLRAEAAGRQRVALRAVRRAGRRRGRRGALGQDLLGPLAPRGRLQPVPLRGIGRLGGNVVTCESPLPAHKRGSGRISRRRLLDAQRPWRGQFGARDAGLGAMRAALQPQRFREQGVNRRLGLGQSQLPLGVGDLRLEELPLDLGVLGVRAHAQLPHLLLDPPRALLPLDHLEVFYLLPGLLLQRPLLQPVQLLNHRRPDLLLLDDPLRQVIGKAGEAIRLQRTGTRRCR
mmetsp:Transcript_19202/g.55755  ORF Transcript_19202/g.55755 Transcript_19202/m.55755 type:complete len:236 (-) Transcript_19202:860-1567(-)